MERLHIEATKSTPLIDFDHETGRLIVKGESYPEYAAKFYAPVFAWLTDHLKADGGPETVLDLEIAYFNSSSSKALMNIFDMLEEAAEAGSSITVNWRYDEKNEAAEECGEEFKEDIENITFNLVKI